MPTPEELQFDLEKLKEHVEKRRNNIEIFEKALADERAAVEHELQIIAVLEADLGGA